MLAASRWDTSLVASNHDMKQSFEAQLVSEQDEPKTLWFPQMERHTGVFLAPLKGIFVIKLSQT